MTYQQQGGNLALYSIYWEESSSNVNFLDDHFWVHVMHQRSEGNGLHIHPRAGEAALPEILLNHLDRCRVRLQDIPDDRPSYFRVSYVKPLFDFNFKLKFRSLNHNQKSQI
jgi:hypothetical protein